MSREARGAEVLDGEAHHLKGAGTETLRRVEPEGTLWALLSVDPMVDRTTTESRPSGSQSDAGASAATAPA